MSDLTKIGTTNQEVINGFRVLVAGKTQLSDDTGWSVRKVYFFMLRYRSHLLKKKQNSRQSLSHWNYQTIPCIPLIKARISECPCQPADGCLFLKTKYAIPVPLDNLKSVTSFDGMVNYSFVEWERFRLKLESSIPAERTTAYYTIKMEAEGPFLFLYNGESKKLITITGIFENPLEVQYYPDCKGVVPGCKYPLSERFILDPDLMPELYNMAITQMLRAKQLGDDVRNNDKDDISIPAGGQGVSQGRSQQRDAGSE